MDVNELVKKERREYYRKWRAENKDKVRENNARYWKKRALKKLETQKETTNSKEGDCGAPNNDSR